MFGKKTLWVLLGKASPAGIYLLKVNNGTKCDICSNLTKKTPERHYWRRSGVFIAKFEYILQFVQVFLLSTLNMWLPARPVIITNLIFIQFARLCFDSQK